MLNKWNIEQNCRSYPSLYLALLLQYCITLIFGCNKVPERAVMDLPNKFLETEFSMSDIFSEIRFITLDPDEPFNKPLDLLYKDSIFYIPTWGGNIYKFGYDGDLIGTLERQGRGPGEYLGIVDFIINDTNIFINVGLAGRQINVYDLELNYVRNIKYPIEVDFGKTVLFDRKFYLFSRPFSVLPDFDWICFNMKGEIQTSKPFKALRSPSASSVTGSDIFFKNNDLLYVYREVSDTIFEIDKYGKYRPVYIIDRRFKDGFNLFSIDDISNYPRPIGRRSIEKIVGLKKYWLIQYIRNSIPAVQETVLFDTKEVKSYLLSSKIIDIGIPFNTGIPFDWVGSGFLPWSYKLNIDGNDYLAALLDPIKIINFARSDSFKNSIPKFPNLKQEIVNLANSLEMDDNQVIMLLKLK